MLFIINLILISIYFFCTNRMVIEKGILKMQDFDCHKYPNEVTFLKIENQRGFLACVFQIKY